MSHYSHSISANKRNQSKKLENCVLALFTMSIPMMPIFTIYGFYLVGFLVVLLSFVKLFKQKILLTSFDKLYFIFILFNLLSIFWSVSQHAIVIVYSTIYFLMVFSYVHLLFCVNRNRDDAVSFWMKWYLTGTVLISCVCLFYERNTIGFERMGTYLFEEPYGTYMMYSYSVCISLFISLSHVLEKKYIYLLPFIFLILCTILNGARKVLLGIIIFAILAFFIKNKKNHIRLLVGFVIMALLCILIYNITMENELLYNTFGYRIEAYFDYLESGSGDGSAMERRKMVKYGINYFLDSPLLGWGTHSFIYLFSHDTGIKLYSHNNYVELLCNLGIIGFIIYYLIYFRLIVGMNLKANHYVHFGLFLPGLISLLVLDYWTISYFRIQFLLFLGLASMYIDSNSQTDYGLDNYIMRNK